MSTNENPTLVNTATAGDERLLREFRYAVDHWFARLTPEGKRAAVEYLQTKVQT